MNSPYDVFSVDETAANEGVWLDYGSFRLRVARAWQGNQGFSRLLDATMKPYKRLLDNGTMDPEVMKTCMAKVYAQRIIRAVEYKDKSGAWKPGFIGPDGKVVAADAASIERLLLDLPDLFEDVVNQSKSLEPFRKELAEVEAKN